MEPSKLDQIGGRKQFEVKEKKEPRRYDQTPFINARPRSSRFILTALLPVCSTCFYLGGPHATPPRPDVDHRHLHNGDCVHPLNDRPVHTSYKEPPQSPTHYTHIKNNWAAWQIFFFGSSVPWFIRQTDMTKDLSHQTSDCWARMSSVFSESHVAALITGNVRFCVAPTMTFLFIMFGLMSC